MEISEEQTNWRLVARLWLRSGGDTPNTLWLIICAQRWAPNVYAIRILNFIYKTQTNYVIKIQVIGKHLAIYRLSLNCERFRDWLPIPSTISLWINISVQNCKIVLILSVSSHFWSLLFLSSASPSSSPGKSLSLSLLSKVFHCFPNELRKRGDFPSNACSAQIY